MKLVVSDFYQDKRHVIEGNENNVRLQLLDLYPFLLVKYGPKCDLDILVNALNRSQFCSAAISYEMAKSEDIGDCRFIQNQIDTNNHYLEACKEAAAFLSGKECTPKELRQALLQTDGNEELAALQAHGLSEKDLPDLRAVLSSALKKSEKPEENKTVYFKDFVATTSSAQGFTNSIKKASAASTIQTVFLGPGKHVGGMLLARDPETHESFLLKPGAGKQNPIAGEDESSSTQSQREACFYAVAESWGLKDYLPECRLLLLDGKEYACMAMLPPVYKNMNELKAKDPNLPKRLLALYNDGTLHRWAALDYVLGNPDRHSGNVMAAGDSIKLIDHGSAFAGKSFDPAKDGMSFVPYYLRPNVVGFGKMSTSDKLRNMPRLNYQNQEKVKQWLLEIKGNLLTQVMTIYGIDSTPELERMERLQAAVGYQTVDLAILSAWVVG